MFTDKFINQYYLYVLHGYYILKFTIGILYYLSKYIFKLQNITGLPSESLTK